MPGSQKRRQLMPGQQMPAGDAPTRELLAALRSALGDGSLLRLVLTKPPRAGVEGGRDPTDDAGRALPVKVSARLIRLKAERVVQWVETHPTRDLTRNLPPEVAATVVSDWLAAGFRQVHLQTGDDDIELLIGKRGRQTLLRSKRPTGRVAGHPPADAETRSTGSAACATATGSAVGPAPPPLPLALHDRVKQRPIALDRPWLQCLGVTDARCRLIPAMARKWKQINKFVEVLDHALAESGLGVSAGAANRAPIEILDFGSGKGYLTFATHDHLRHSLGLPARVTGVDLKADMIALCNRAAAQVGAEGLGFERGDVQSLAPRRVDVMIALHACDTATDHALHAGLRAGARIIMCSPCCHKELRPQLLSPHPLRPILKHGVHLGLQAEMLTDGLRAMLLEACGYTTRVFEFISPEQTSKNKMILAVRRGAAAGDRSADAPAEAAVWQQIADLKAFYGIQAQCLETLLRADRRPAPGAVTPSPGASMVPSPPPSPQARAATGRPVAPGAILSDTAEP